MSTATTTIRIPEKIKARVAKLAKSSGTTAHAFILEAITQKTEMAERYAAFLKLAAERRAEIRATGLVIDWEDLKPYLEAKAAGKDADWPKARQLER